MTDRDSLRLIAERLESFGAALGGLPRDTLLAALSGQAVLSGDERLDIHLARRLADACADVALADPKRRRLYDEVSGLPDLTRFEPLRAAIEADLKDPQRAFRYPLPRGVRENQALGAFLAMKAGHIAEAFHDCDEPGPLRERLVEIITAFASAGSSSATPNLKVMVARRELPVGETVAIEVYRSHNGRTYNVTRRAELRIQPPERAEVEGQTLRGLSPGPVRVLAEVQGGRAHADLAIVAAAEDPDANDTILTDSFAAAPTISLPPGATAEARATIEAEARREATPAPTPPPPPSPAPTPPPTPRPARPTREWFDRPALQQVPIPGMAQDDIPTMLVTRRDAPQSGEVTIAGGPLQDGAASGEVSGTVFEESSGEGTARFLGDEPGTSTVRLGPPPLVMGLVFMAPSEGGDEMDLNVDGHRAVSAGRVSFQHVLLGPGMRLLELELTRRNQRIAAPRVAVEWQPPRVSKDEAGAAAEPPPLCLELLLRLDGQGELRSRLRLLSPQSSLSPTDLDSGAELRMVKKPGETYCASLDLVRPRTELQVIGRKGEHRLTFIFQQGS